MTEDLIELKKKVDMLPKPRPIKLRWPNYMLFTVIIIPVFLFAVSKEMFTSISAQFGTKAKAVVISKYTTYVGDRTDYWINIGYPLPAEKHMASIEISKGLYSLVNEKSLLDIRYIPAIWFFPFVEKYRWAIMFCVIPFLLQVLLAGFYFYTQRSLMLDGIPVIAKILDETAGRGGSVITVEYECNTGKKSKRFTGCDKPDTYQKTILLMINQHDPNDAFVYDSTTMFVFDFNSAPRLFTSK